MKSATTVRRVVLSIIGVFITGAVVAGAISVQATATKPGITAQISPASQSITRGTTALYTVTLTYTGGFTGPVVLNATGLPSGSTGTFTALTTTLTWVLSVPTTANTAAGSYTLNVTATSTSSGAKVSGSVTAGLTVNDPVADSLTMSATPASVTMGPGSTAVYTIQLVRTGVTGNVTLSVGGLPAGATGTFSPNPASGSSSSSTLQVTTTANTLDGSYTLLLTASGKNSKNATLLANTSAQLVISTSSSPFTISGNLSTRLTPGATLPLELALTNPNKKSLSVTNLSVTLLSLTRTQFAINSGQSCKIADYGVTQYSGPYPLVIPGSSSPILLSTLGVPSTQWPKISFRDTSSNQDGCKGATLALSYSGSGQGN